MIFTKGNVELYWKILNSSQSTDEKKMADQYLIEFKVKGFKIKYFRNHLWR